jgi:hypothetical protein
VTVGVGGIAVGDGRAVDVGVADGVVVDLGVGVDVWNGVIVDVVVAEGRRGTLETVRATPPCSRLVHQTIPPRANARSKPTITTGNHSAIAPSST